MKVLNKLTFKSLKLNRKRSIGTIVGILLSVALICAIAGMGASFRQTLINSAIKDTGYHHITVYDTTEEKVKKIELNRDFKEVYKTYDIGYAKFEYERGEDFPYIHIESLSSSDLKPIGIEVTKGHIPNNENEIMISEYTAKYGKLDVGDIITLDVGKRVIDGYELHDGNSYQEEEEFVSTKKVTYKIVGVFFGYNYNYQMIGFTINDKNEDKVTAYISLKDPMNYKSSISKFLEVKDINDISESSYRKIHEELGDYSINRELLRWEAFALSDSTVSSLLAIMTVVIVIVVITSVFCIRNSFAISTTEKIKMYGMLASVGTTKKQIKKCVILEGMILSLIGIPLGVLCGIIADVIIVKIVNLLIGGAFSGEAIALTISWVPILIAVILGFITVYLSSISSARKASKVSPIENLRNSNEINITNKKLRTPKIINKLFKTGGVLAYKNLKRSKKKYRTTVISLTISIMIFITMNAFINEGFNLTGDYYTDYKYNLSISGVYNISQEEVKNIKNLENFKLFVVNYASSHYLEVDPSNLNEFSKRFNNCYYEDDEEVCDYEVGMSIIALDHESYLAYLKELKLNYEDVRFQGILADDYKYHEQDKIITKRIYKYKKGDTINGKIDDKDFNIKIAAIADKRPIGLESTYFDGGYLIVDYNDFGDIDYIIDSIYINTDNHYDIGNKISDMLPQANVYDIEEEAKMQRNVIIVVEIFLYGFITVITLIGVTNIFNTITSNMELRQKEFCMLKSVGMTKREFNRMVNLETIFYSSKSLIYGIVLGILGSYLIHQAFGLKTVSTFNLPIMAIIIAIIFVFIIVFIIMHYSIGKINKQNIIETIRKDNI